MPNVAHVATLRAERDKVVAKARKICADPAKQAEWRAAWVRVCDRLEPIYKARRPVMRSFEVHHANEVAREAFLRAAVAGVPLDQCEQRAFEMMATKEDERT